MSANAPQARLPERFPRLATARLVLDEVRAGDEDALYDVFRDEQATRYWSTTAWPDEKPARVLIERARELFARNEAVRWALRQREDTRLIGTATLFAISSGNRRAELGYILARPRWGQGYMRESLTAILDWAFGPFGLHRVEADTDPRNEASLALLGRLGFVREGHLRERWIVGGEICDSLLLGLLASEWTRARGAGSG
jgi:RimJ/RimL family protein N-acetyltransferase